MSSLKKALDKLDHKNDGAPAPSLAAPIVQAPCGGPLPSTVVPGNGDAPRCLRLAALDGRAWELPWGSFYGASFAPAGLESGALDCIELSFARHEVVLRGRQLAKLMDALHAMSLSEVRTVDGRFFGGACSDDGRPVVAVIEVRKMGH